MKRCDIGNKRASQTSLLWRRDFHGNGNEGRPHVVPFDPRRVELRKPGDSLTVLNAKGNDLSKRELIDTGTDKRYVRRDHEGQFKDSDDVGKSLAADQRTKAKTVAKKGDGDQGDRSVDHSS